MRLLEIQNSKIPRTQINYKLRANILEPPPRGWNESEQSSNQRILN